MNGITPAHAGTTLYNCFLPVQFKDHPRSRGDYGIPNSILIANEGSPPLTRGLLRLWLPTAVGAEDHPRSRGDY